MVRNFICVLRSGGDFNWDYVRVLKANLSGRTAGPYNLYCLTDAVTREQEVDGIWCLPFLKNWPGRWSKIELFRPDLEKCRPCLFLDLDTAITGPIELILQPLRAMRKWAMLRDLYKPERPASGLMYFPRNKDWNPVWEDFVVNGEGIIRQDPRADDGLYIYKRMYPEMFFQDAFPGRISSFKPLVNGQPQWLVNGPPPKVVVVCFHGSPRPPEAAETVPWVRTLWAQATRPCPSSLYPHRHKGTLLIVGSGPTWETDYMEAVRHRPDAHVMAIGHAAGLVKADFLVTDHYEVHSELVRLQLAFHDGFTNHCTRCSGGRRYGKWVDYWWDWPRADASSAQTAIRIGLEMGFEEVVLCGCPMEAGAMVHPDQARKDHSTTWPPPNRITKEGGTEVLRGFREHFARYAPDWRARGVRSLSGWTRKQLGGPAW